MRTAMLMLMLIGCGGSDGSNAQCGALASVCKKSGDCCSGLCTPTNFGPVCSCLTPHQPCTTDEQCCGNSCSAGLCGCYMHGASCNDDSDCCSNTCDDGVCADPPDLAPPPDLMPPPPPDLAKPAPCDPALQTSCPSGDACYVLGSTPTCHAAGAVQTGGKCSSETDCVGGDQCYDAISLCHTFCDFDDDCRTTPGNQLPVSSANVSYCYRTLSGSSARLCTIPCNPVPALGSSGCRSGKCDAESFSAGTAEYTECRAAGSAAEGASCTYDTDCGEGLECIDTPGHCRRMCRKGNDGDCAAIAGDTCHNLTGWTQFGACCPSSGC